MSTTKRVTLQDAKDQLLMLIKDLTVTEGKELFSFMSRQISRLERFDGEHDAHHECCHDSDNSAADEERKNTDRWLGNISNNITELLPFSATFPSENIVPPKKGENANCDPNITVHVDEFLYDDNEVDKLIEDGKLSKYYCSDCGSKNLAPQIFLSHSMSRDALRYIFKILLPSLFGKTVLDIGSRLGAVLYGAYAYSGAMRIIGVEMNEEFCQIQRRIVQKYKMDDRIEVLHKRIEEAPELVGASDVIVINNPFEFYLPEPTQIEIWKMLQASIKKGTLLVTRPHMESILEHLDTGISLKDWLKPVEQAQSYCYECTTKYDCDEYKAFCESKFVPNIACYEVL